MRSRTWSPRRTALTVTFVYLLAGGLWILSSDRLLIQLVDAERPLYQHVQTYKGWLFVVLTGLLLYVMLHHTLRRVRRTETKMENLLAGTGGVTGEAFFPALAQHLARALEVDHVIVVATNGAADQPPRPLGRYGRNRDTPIPDVAMLLAQAPCGELLRQKKSCLVPSGLRQKYPANEAFGLIRAESCLAVPLVGSDGQAIGAIVALHGASLPDPDQARDLIDAFAGRAAAELERVRAVEQARRLTETLDHNIVERTRELQEANDELNAFTSTMGHDLQMPLRGLQQFARSLLQAHAAQLDDTGREYAVRIVGSTARMQQMISEMLDYSRLRHGAVPLESVSSVLVVHEAIGRLSRDPELSRTLFDVHEPLPWVRANRLLLSQVVLNLLASCAQLVPREIDPVVRIWATIDGGWAGVWFETNAGRIQPEDRHRLFGLFAGASDAESYETADFGLALIRRSIERMGGTISIEDAPNDGTRFCIELPLADGENGRTRAKKSDEATKRRSDEGR